MSGAHLDLAEARSRALAALRPPVTAGAREEAVVVRQLLEQPLLAGWPYEDWIATERHRSEDLVDRLTAVIDGS